MEKRAFGRQKSGRFQEQKPTNLLGNSDLEKRNFLTAKFVAFVEPPSRQNSHEYRSTKQGKKGDIWAQPKYRSMWGRPVTLS